MININLTVNLLLPNRFIYLLPDSVWPILLALLMKDKTGKVSHRNNHRSITLASIIFQKDFCRINKFFKFKPKHGTGLCMYILKEIINKHKKRSHQFVFVLFLCLQTFDCVKQSYFAELSHKGMPEYIVRVLIYSWIMVTLCRILRERNSELLQIKKNNQRPRSNKNQKHHRRQ